MFKPEGYAMSTILEPRALEATEPASCTLEDLYERFGPMPYDRIRQHPAPGTATDDDVLEIHDREGVLCELVDGVLVEKTVGLYESMEAMRLVLVIGIFVRQHRLGEVFGEAGFMKLKPGLVRIPDVSFVSKAKLKVAKIRPGQPLVKLVPELAVEVLSKGNTKKEMDRKLVEYFDAGVQLVWYVDPRPQTVTVYQSPEKFEVIAPPASLVGDPVLPGLTISLTELFAPPDED
jgi:Uma2 family endonuclease